MIANPVMNLVLKGMKFFLGLLILNLFMLQLTEALKTVLSVSSVSLISFYVVTYSLLKIASLGLFSPYKFSI